MKNTFTTEHAAEIEAAQRANKDKQIEARLKVLALRVDGKSLREISEITRYHRSLMDFVVRSESMSIPARTVRSIFYDR